MRWAIAVAISIILILPATTASALSFGIRTTGGPTPITRGGSESITAYVKPRTAGSYSIDVDIYNSAGIKQIAYTYNAISFKTNQEKSFHNNWIVPVGATFGTYTVQVSVFSANRATRYVRDTTAGSFVVSSTVPTATPSGSTATPTPTVVQATNTPTVTPVIATLTPTPTAGTSPSGQSMPVGDLTGWHQVFTEDFLTDLTVGSWPGVYGPKWDYYLDCWHDTSGIGFYYPSTVLSVTGGVLNYHVHTEQNICGVSGGSAVAAAPVPRLPSPMTYGKYTMRFRADSLVGFKTAWLLWPDSDCGCDGEIDFPEGDLNSTISAFMHYKDNTSSGQQDAFDTTATYPSWHTASTEWIPGKVTFILDGIVIGISTTRVPNTPMHWVLQTETCIDNCQPSATVVGNVQIDWVTAYTRQ